MTVARITEAFVRDAPPGVYSDETLRGFMLRVGIETRAFHVQAMVRGGKQVRRKFGVYPSIRADAARREAADVLHAMRRGTDPREAERERRAASVTLGEALEQYLAGKRLAPRTAEGYRYFVRKYLPDWTDRTLEEIGRDREGVRERMARIYREAARRPGRTRTTRGLGRRTRSPRSSRPSTTGRAGSAPSCRPTPARTSTSAAPAGATWSSTPRRSSRGARRRSPSARPGATCSC
jgi:hypothetical protein